MGEPSVMGAFGYSKEDPKRPKTRKYFSQIVQWIKLCKKIKNE